MKILIDTNVILDITLERQPFFEQSARLFKTVLQSDVGIFITATTITDLYYIIRKAKNREVALNFIKDLLKFTEIAAVDRNVIMEALKLDLADFEDAIQVSAANDKNVNIIVTRNEADFSNSNMEVYSPKSFLDSINP